MGLHSQCTSHRYYIKITWIMTEWSLFDTLCSLELIKALLLLKKTKTN